MPPASLDIRNRLFQKKKKNIRITLINTFIFKLTTKIPKGQILLVQKTTDLIRISLLLRSNLKSTSSDP